MKAIDMNSEEFLTELEKTKKFTDKVNKQFGWVYNPNEDVNEGVIMGLARHKLLKTPLFITLLLLCVEDFRRTQTLMQFVCKLRTETKPLREGCKVLRFMVGIEIDRGQ